MYRVVASRGWGWGTGGAVAPPVIPQSDYKALINVISAPSHPEIRETIGQEFALQNHHCPAPAQKILATALVYLSIYSPMYIYSMMLLRDVLTAASPALLFVPGQEMVKIKIVSSVHKICD